MTAIPIQVEIGSKLQPIVASKLAYLQKANQQLQEDCDEMTTSLKANKCMLEGALEQLSKFRSGEESLEKYKHYAEGCIHSLNTQLTNMTTKLQGEVQARRRETSRVLISEQIREEQMLFYRQVLKEYQIKILELMASVQEKEIHVQMLEDADTDPNENYYKAKMPSREVMKVINQFDINLIMVEKFKEENEELKKMLFQEQNSVKKLQKELSKINVTTRNPRNRISLAEKYINEVKCRSSDRQIVVLTPDLSIYKRDSDANGTTQASTDLTSKLSNSRTKSNKYTKKNQTIFQNMVMLYKREQLNCKLISRKLTEVQSRLINEVNEKQQLQRSNMALQEELKKLREYQRRDPRSRPRPEHAIRSCQKIPSDKSFDSIYQKRKSQAQERKKHVAEMYSRFRQQFLRLQAQILHSSSRPRRKMHNSISCAEIAFTCQNQPNSCEDEPFLLKKQESIVLENDFSEMIELESKVRPSKVVTFTDYFQKRPRQSGDSLLHVFECSVNN